MTEKKTTKRIAVIFIAAVCMIGMCFMPAAYPAFAADGAAAQEQTAALELKAEAKGPSCIRLTWSGVSAPEQASGEQTAGEPASGEQASEEQAAETQTVEYRVYRSDAGEKPVRATAETGFTDSGLSPAEKYTYRVEAWTGGEEPSMIAKSEEVSCTTPKQTATVTGFSKSLAQKARKKLSVSVSVTGTMGSPVLLQYYNGKKWITKRTVSTLDTAASQQVTLQFPNFWWKKTTTKWRYCVKKGAKNTGARYGTVTLKTKKYYQNPKKYVKIRNKISKHGHHYYTSPVLTNNMSTRKQHVEAMIKTAKKYLGDPYVDCRSRAPGKGVDCSGLVMQACYGAGVDLWPSNPWRHRFPKFEYESRRIAKMKTLRTVKWKNRRRGDLIFYSRGGRVMHVAIYLGHGRIIHSSYPNVRISSATNPTWGRISRVARVFN